MVAATGTQAVDRAALVLITVLEAPRASTLGDLQARTGLPKSTLSRLVSSLERHGLVSRNPDSSIRSGPALHRYAHSPQRAADLITVAQPHLQALAEATGETINLAVVVDDEVEQLSQVDPKYFLGSINWVGQRVPLHCSAQGKAFLAHGTALPESDLERRTPRSLCDRGLLATELDTTRARGWALADGELEPGLVAIAAPVLGTRGVALAALSVSGPETRLRPQIEDIAARLVFEAAALAKKLVNDPSTPEG